MKLSTPRQMRHCDTIAPETFFSPEVGKFAGKFFFLLCGVKEHREFITTALPPLLCQVDFSKKEAEVTICMLAHLVFFLLPEVGS